MGYRVLGPVEVLDGDRPRPLRSEKQRGLLAILLTRPGRLASVDWLIEELWRGSPPETAASALRMHVTGLRRVLEPDRPRSAPSVRLPLAQPGYRLNMEPDELDAQRFERLLVLAKEAVRAGRRGEASELLTQGLGLWRGPAFSGVDDYPSIRLEVQRLEELQLSAFEELVDCRLALGRHEEVLPSLVEAIGRQPLRERFTEQLALALYRSGRQADALRTIDILRRRLREEMGLELSVSVRGLELGILEQQPSLSALPHDHSLAATPGPADPLPSFVGRKRELDELRVAFEAVRRGACRAVFLSGAPGMGKTALAGTFATAVEAEGATVCLGHCDAESIGLYQPFAEALRSLLRRHPLPSPVDPLTAEVARLVPEIASSSPEAGTGVSFGEDSDRHRLFEAVAGVLRTVGNPVVLVLNDLQWADTSSLLLLRHLVRHGDAGQLLFVGSYRDNDLHPGSRLLELVGRLHRDHGAVHLPLTGLDEAEVEELVRATTRAEVLAHALALVPELHHYTGGNPFFIGQVLQRMGDQPLGEAQPALRDLVPPAVDDLVAQHLLPLSDRASTLLRAAAVIGMEFDLRLLTDATGAGEEEVLGAVEEALSSRLVVEVGPGIDCFGFIHSLVRDVLYRSIPQSRRTRVHRDIARALERFEGGLDRGRLMQLAHHHLEAVPLVDPTTAARYAEQAAGEAEASMAYEDALDLSRRGLAVLEDGAHDRGATPEACDLRFRLGRAELLTGRGEARETLLRSADEASELGDPDRMAAAVLSLNRGFFARMGRTDHPFVERIERAMAVRHPGDDPLTAQLLATLASELVWAEDGDRRFGLSDEALAMARRLGDHRTLARVLLLRNMTISAPDTLAERSKECAELVRLAEELRDPWIRFQAAFHGSGTAHEARDLETAHQLVQIGAGVALELRQPSVQWLADFMLTGSHLGRGELERAEELANRALEVGLRAGRGAEAQVFFGEQFLEIRRWQDRLPEVLDFFAHLAGRPDADFGYSLLRYLYDAGETSDASAIYDEVVDRLALPLRRDLLLMPTLCNLSYLAVRFDDVDRASLLYPALEPWGGIASKTTVARPVGDHYLGMLAGVVGDREHAQSHLSSALDAHLAMELPLLADETQIELAALLTGDGGEGCACAAELREVEQRNQATGARLLVRRADRLLRPSGSG
jgi:DNA-binding SARP family transcriptional activator